VKITAEHDVVAGTVRVVLELSLHADPDRMGDAAWEATTRAMHRAQRAAGTVPEGLRAARQER